MAAGSVAGIVIGVLLIIGIMLGIFAVLLRLGYLAPVRRGLRSMTIKYRKSVRGFRTRRTMNDYGDSGENRDSLYMYGEMDFKDLQSWQFARDDVALQSLLKSGNFADIYLATLRPSNTTVVAKTLKQGYGKQDELLMKAKINFNAMEVGSHENVLRFIGAVCSDSDIGPFIIFEHCRNGTLKDYLETAKNANTLEIQERCLRFGLGIARGMEYLAGRKIVHRRLAARNVLLNDDFVVKIYGFGPQPDQDSDGEHSKKRERVPLKWMAPECLKSTVGATEKSDVWSFGIVLWEIFSLGDSPYDKIRGRDLPGKLKSGYRLAKPELCDDKWYGVMKRAWTEDPAERPTFEQIRSELDEVFVAAPVDDYYIYRK